MFTARLVYADNVYSYPCALCRTTGLPFSGIIIRSLFQLFVSDTYERCTPYTYNAHYSDRECFHWTVGNDSPVKHTGSAYTSQQG